MRYLIILMLLALTAAPIMAQEKSNIEIRKLTESLYELTATYPFSSNMVASVGEDGILLVDVATNYTAEELGNLVKTLGNGQVKFIIYTHAHKEHIGGNIAFGSEVVRIGHESLRTRLKSGTYLLEEYSDTTLPIITFTDSLSLYFNGEKIRLIAVPGAHDDGDIIVHFTKSGVVSTGALSTGMHFPSVDGIGGNALKYSANVQRVIDLLPADVTLVPGHGRNTTMAEEKQFQDMIAKTVDIVRDGLAGGKDVAALQKDKVLKDWNSFEGGFVTADQWIQIIANGVNNIKPPKPAAVELYLASKNYNVDSSLAKWYELKKNNPNDYSFGEGQLAVFGYHLLGKGKTGDAIKIFELYVKEFPKAWNAYDCLAEAYMKDGRKDLAIKNYKKSLKLNPQNTNGADILKELES
jgi:cyclase